jgi:hypothetical protein
VADGYVLSTSVVLGTDMFGHIDGWCDDGIDGPPISRPRSVLGVSVGALTSPRLDVLLSSGVGTSVGSTVGSTVGCVSRCGAKLRQAVGAVLGSSVGRPMGGLVSTGCIEGSNVGVSDGDSLRPSVDSVGAMPSPCCSGVLLRCSIGVTVGPRNGSMVVSGSVAGTAGGTAIDSPVGMAVGSAVGLAVVVGCAVSVAIGSGVGARLDMPLGSSVGSADGAWLGG